MDKKGPIRETERARDLSKVDQLGPFSTLFYPFFSELILFRPAQWHQPERCPSSCDHTPRGSIEGESWPADGQLKLMKGEPVLRCPTDYTQGINYKLIVYNSYKLVASHARL